jgi:hypothetical protein
LATANGALAHFTHGFLKPFIRRVSETLSATDLPWMDCMFELRRETVWKQRNENYFHCFPKGAQELKILGVNNFQKNL